MFSYRMTLVYSVDLRFCSHHATIFKIPLLIYRKNRKQDCFINSQGLDAKEKEVPKIKINSASTPTEQRTPLTAHV